MSRYKPYVSQQIHNRIFEMKDKLKHGDMRKISNISGIKYNNILNFFGEPDALSQFMLDEIYIVVEKFIENNRENACN